MKDDTKPHIMHFCHKAKNNDFEGNLKIKPKSIWKLLRNYCEEICLTTDHGRATVEYLIVSSTQGNFSLMCYCFVGLVIACPNSTFKMAYCSMTRN